MPASVDRPAVELRGLGRRGGARGAVLVLSGAGLGELKRAVALAAKLSDKTLLVAVDGGLTTCSALGRRPDLLVGDGDSARRVPSGIPNVRFDREKDFSDLGGAWAELRRRRVRFVVLAGLLGGRLDHEWANLLECGSVAPAFAALLAPTARGTVVVTAHGCRMATTPGRTCSLFGLGAGATVTLRGTRWELARRRLRPGSHGLSNVAGTDLDLTVHEGVAALVVVPPKRRRRT